MNLLMGKLYRYSRNNRSAITCYKECLRFVLVFQSFYNKFLALDVLVLGFYFKNYDVHFYP